MKKNPISLALLPSVLALSFGFVPAAMAQQAQPTATATSEAAPAETAPVASADAAPAAAEAANDGTDPTKLTSNASVNFEHVDLRNGFTAETLAFSLTQPLGSGNTNIRLRVPVESVDVLGDSGYGIGDISVKSTHVLNVTRHYGMVISGEVTFDTAGRDELGSGKTVFAGSFVYARFLPGGHIFAPALVHSISVEGDDARGDVNSTTIDFYFVPKLDVPNLFMTIDPAITNDWENDNFFGSLAVTLGYRVGRMFGGNGQISIKPAIFLGGDRLGNWGLTAGFSVLNF